MTPDILDKLTSIKQNYLTIKIMPGYIFISWHTCSLTSLSRLNL
jgi:hypothetical protein